MLAENEELETEPAAENMNEPPTEGKDAVEKSADDISSEASAEKPAAETKKPADKQKKRPRKISAQLKQIIQGFSACARCSFFLAGYKTALGDDALEEAAGDLDAGWMPLTWNQSVRSLVHKSYGSRLDMDCYFFDGICPDCLRQFSFRGAEADGEPDSFRIEVKPRVGR